MKKHLLLLIPLLLATLACQAVMQGLLPTPTTTPTLPPTATATLPPTATFTPQPTHTATPEPTLSPTPVPTGSAFQQQVFDELWTAVDENYLYPDFNGLDWDQVYQEYSQRIQAGLSDADFYAALAEMVNRLGDEHSAFFTPEEAKEEDEHYAGNYNFVGIGILTLPVPERQRITIIAVFPGSPAEQAGLQIHDNILAVDGLPIIDDSGVRRDRLVGLEGSSMTITVQTPDQEPRPVTITRQRVNGEMPVIYQALNSASGKRIGYILLVSFAEQSIDEQARQAIEAMSAEAPLDGLILDNRVNGGGYSDVVTNMLSYFTKGTVGYFISHDAKDPLNVQAQNIAGSQRLPLVVLVGEGTASFGEIFSGVLQDQGRAYVIGKTTDGNVEILYIYNFSDGSRAWLAHETFRPLNHPEQDWEKTGIIPDLAVSSNWDEVTLQSDPVVQAALEYLDGR